MASRLELLAQVRKIQQSLKTLDTMSLPEDDGPSDFALPIGYIVIVMLPVLNQLEEELQSEIKLQKKHSSAWQKTLEDIQNLKERNRDISEANNQLTNMILDRT